MLERDIQKKVNEYALKRGVLIKRFLNKGDPDRLYIFPDGKVIFIEFKQLGKKPTALQTSVLSKLKQYHCGAYVVDSVQKGIELINAYLRESA